MFTNEYVAVKFLFFFVFVYGNACGGVGGGGGGGGGLDCEQSHFFFRFSEGSAHGLDGPRKERETTRSLWVGGERKKIFQQ